MVSNRVVVSLSDEHMELLEKKCMEQNVNRSKYIRNLLDQDFGRVPKEIAHKELISKFSSVDTKLKSIVIRDELTDVERIFITDSIKQMKDMLVKILEEDD